MSKTHQLLAFFVTLIWGTNFVFIKYGLDELPPFLFATIRFFLVAFPLVFFMKRPKASWGLIAAYGLLIGFGQFGVLFYAMQNDISPTGRATSSQYLALASFAQLPRSALNNLT